MREILRAIVCFKDFTIFGSFFRKKIMPFWLHLDHCLDYKNNPINLIFFVYKISSDRPNRGFTEPNRTEPFQNGSAEPPNRTTEPLNRK